MRSVQRSNSSPRSPSWGAPARSWPLKFHPFRRYVIFYLPMNDGIDVVRVLHSARDVDTAFHEAQ